MNIDPYILAFSAITVIVTIWMGFRSARTSKTASDFFVAGRSVGVGMNASAISGEYLSAASFMGVAGMVMSSGYDALWYPVCYACGYLFLLLFIAGPLRRFGAYTIPDFAEGRFDSPLFRKIAVVFVLFIGFFYTMPQMKGAGTTLAYIFPGLPYWAGVVLVGAVITLNVALGGMKGITLVQAFQYWIKMFAISVPIFVLMAVYGHYGKQLKLNNVSAPATGLTNTFTFEPLVGRDEPQLKIGMTLSEIAAYARSKVHELELLRDRNRDKTYPAGVMRMMGADLESIVLSYREISGCILLKANIQYPRAVLTFSVTNAISRQELLHYLDEQLAKDRLVFLPYGENVRVLCTFSRTNEMATYLRNFGTTDMVRRELPEKAPKDDVWLSPFGPLTTKAAKAAAGALKTNVTLMGEVSLPTNATILPAGSFRFVNASTDQVLEIYSELTGWTLLPRRNPLVDKLDQVLRGQLTRMNLRQPITLPPAKVTAESDKPVTIAEFKKIIEDTLATNGVSLVVVDEKYFRAVKTSDLKLYVEDLAKNGQQAWLDKHQKPLALLYTYSLIIAIVCGTAGLPHILVRFYTNPDGVAAKRTTMWVMILIGVFYVFPPVFGVIGRNLLPELYSGVGAKGTDKIVLELPRIISERYGVLGSILSGITCAGAFAAFMSTFSGLLVSMTGALAHDVYGRMLNPKASAEQRMKMFKWCAVLIGGVAVLLGSFVEPLEINFMVGQAFAIAAASYFPLLFMAVWWRKLTMKGAATGMLTGGLSALVGISLTSFSTLAVAPGKTGELFALFKPLNDFWAAHPLLRILCEQPAIWAVPLAIILMVIVSKLTAKDVPPDIRMKMLVLHAPEKLGLKQEYIQEHQPGH